MPPIVLSLDGRAPRRALATLFGGVCEPGGTLRAATRDVKAHPEGGLAALAGYFR